MYSPYFFLLLRPPVPYVLQKRKCNLEYGENYSKLPLKKKEHILMVVHPSFFDLIPHIFVKLTQSHKHTY